MFFLNTIPQTSQQKKSPKVNGAGVNPQPLRGCPVKSHKVIKAPTSPIPVAACEECRRPENRKGLRGRREGLFSDLQPWAPLQVLLDQHLGDLNGFQRRTFPQLITYHAEVQAIPDGQIFSHAFQAAIRM